MLMGTLSNRGFSLMELLMASAIAAVAGGLLAGGLGAANRSAALRGEQIILTQLLAGRLALLGDEQDEQAPTQGTFPAPLDDARWTLEWSSGPSPSLAEAVVAVTRGDRTMELTTFRRLPEE